jgi:hypothetical protein
MSTPAQRPPPARFSIRQVEDSRRSGIEGRKVLVPEDWIAIHKFDGDIIRRPVMPKDIETYPAEYEAWKAGRDTPGTPLAELAAWAPDVLTEEGVLDLMSKYQIRTVEDLVAVPDGTMTYGWGRKLQRKGAELIELRKEEAAQATVARRDTEFDSMRAQLAAQNAEIVRLRELMQGGK